MKETIKSAADLAGRANEDNPREITDDQLAMLAKSMAAFGDLSGLILNRTTGRLVGGHQRVKLLGDAPVTITRRWSKPTRLGTVAEGHVELHGEKFTYRVVKWDARTEQAAMIAANKHGGEWDRFKLRDLLEALRRDGQDMETVGFDTRELDKLLKEPEPPDQFPGVDENIAVQHVCPKCGYKWSGKPG
jgi:ParB-like chromosome segregation protein Spo0J